MAYRRRQGISRSSTFKEEFVEPSSPSSLPTVSTAESSTPNSLAAQALRASSASRNINSPVLPHLESPRSKTFNAYDDPRNDSKGFWGVLARKAKAILDDDDLSQEVGTPNNRVRSSQIMWDASSPSQRQQHPTDGYRRMDNPTIRKGLDKITTSLNQIGDSFEKAFEEGRSIVENRTQDIIQETRKIQIRRKGNSPMAQNQVTDFNSTVQSPRQLQNQTNHETQLKASRDVAMATAAKAKLLLRELKTVKADLAFAKERCAQLEEENKLLRESLEKGDHPEDDDLIRLQLETLLAEKGRLAHENSVYARENRFLREVVEYHQLSMQDVLYLDEGAEELTPVLYPNNFPFSEMLSSDSLPEVKVEVKTTPSSSRNRTRSPSPASSLGQVEVKATPSSSRNRTRSPSPVPSAGQQPLPTQEISPYLTQLAEEASKECHVSNSETDVLPTSTLP